MSRPAFDYWPADHPTIAYITGDGGRLCVACANGENGSRAADPDVRDVALADADPQWRIIGAQTADPGDRCDHCGRAFPV